LADLIAETSRNAVPIEAIAERVAAEHGADHRRPITPRYVGSLLRPRLNLLLYKSNGVYVVPSYRMAEVRELCQRYGVEAHPNIDTLPQSPDMGT